MNATASHSLHATPSVFPRIPRAAAWAIAVVFALGATLSLPTPVAAQLSATGTLEGTVSELDDGALPDATVIARKQVSGNVWNYYETTTADDGSYSITGLGNGDWNVTVRKDGFRTQMADVTVGVGATVMHDVQLAPLAVYFYRATILDGSDESPVAGAKARLESYGDDGSLRTRNATSDADGKLTLRLFPGQNNIIITKSGFAQWNDWVYSPGADVDRMIYLQTVPPQTAHIVGSVIDDETGEPVEAWIELSTDYNYDCCYAYASDSMGIARGEPYPYYGNYNSTATDDEGNFEFWAYAGAVQVQANRAGYLVAIEHLTLAEDETYEVTLRLVKLPERTVTISGRVTDAATGDPLEGASVSVQVPAMADYGYASTDAEGRYSVEVRSGYTLVEVSYYGWCCVVYETMTATPESVPAEEESSENTSSPETTSTSSGSATATGTTAPKSSPVPANTVYFPLSRVFTTEDGDARTLNVALEPKPAARTTVVGYVVDMETQEAVPNARVSMQNHATGDWGEAVTDEAGSYKFMAYGGYHTVRVDLEGYLPYAVNVDLPSSGSERVDLEITAGDQVWEGWWTPDGYGGGGGCGYGYPCPPPTVYAEDSDYETAAGGAPMATATSTSAPGSDGKASGSLDEGAGSQSIVGSGGGLPPYDPANKDDTFSDDSSEAPVPVFGVVVLVGVLAAAVGLRARRE